MVRITRPHLHRGPVQAPVRRRACRPRTSARSPGSAGPCRLAAVRRWGPVAEEEARIPSRVTRSGRPASYQRATRYRDGDPSPPRPSRGPAASRVRTEPAPPSARSGATLQSRGRRARSAVARSWQGIRSAAAFQKRREHLHGRVSWVQRLRWPVQSVWMNTSPPASLISSDSRRVPRLEQRGPLPVAFVGVPADAPPGEHAVHRRSAHVGAA